MSKVMNKVVNKATKRKTLLAASTAITLAIASMTAPIAIADDSTLTHSEVDALKLELIEAKNAVANAQQVAEDIVRLAKEDAAKIVAAAEELARKTTSTTLNPSTVKNAKVAVEINAGTIEEIATSIMPEGWRILLDVKNQDIRERRFQYVSTKSREQALSDLLNSINMSHQYFFELRDTNGEPSPLLVISQR